MTPLQIQMMLHYYAIAEPYAVRDQAHANSPAVKQQRQWLINNGLLHHENCESGYHPTELGTEYIKRLQDMSIKGSILQCPFCNLSPRNITGS